MKSTKILITTSLFAIAALGSTLLTAEEKKLSEKQVPKAVVEAFHKAYPKATGIKYEKEQDAGMTLYEIEFSNETAKLEAIYTAEGILTHTEETIKPADLPAA